MKNDRWRAERAPWAGAGILRQVNQGAGRNRVFAYAAYLDILKEGT